MNQEISKFRKGTKPHLQHLFFPNEDNFAKFCKKLRKCKSTFLGCIYQLTHSSIIDILIQLATDGCRVDIILDQNLEQMEERKKITINKLLILSGFEVNVSLIESKGLMHSKFCVIDNKITIIGSANWTFQAFSQNVENVTIIKDSNTAKYYTEQFKHIWDQAKQAKFVNSQIIYQPNQTCNEFKQSNKISSIQKRKFKSNTRKQQPKNQTRQKNIMKYKHKPKLEKTQLNQEQQVDQIQVQRQQIEEQKKNQDINQIQTKDFFDNLKLNEDNKLKNIAKNNPMKNNIHSQIQQTSNPWQIEQEITYSNLICNPFKRNDNQNQDKNVIIIDEDDDDDVKIISNFIQPIH